MVKLKGNAAYYRFIFSSSSSYDWTLNKYAKISNVLKWDWIQRNRELIIILDGDNSIYFPMLNLFSNVYDVVVNGALNLSGKEKPNGIREQKKRKNNEEVNRKRAKRIN